MVEDCNTTELQVFVCAIQVEIFTLKIMRQYKGTKITKTVLNKKDKARGLSGHHKNPC